MRGRTCGTICALCALTAPMIATADLQNVEVGGSIEIFAGWYSEGYSEDVFLRHYPADVLFRAIGPYGLDTTIRADGRGSSLSFVEQRTRLHVNGDFTDHVRAFIEFDSIDDWGTDFRALNYVTGADQRANSIDDIEVFQAYIETEETGGYPLRLRIGRQEMSFGSGWLVGTNAGPNPFSGLSFDALRLTYASEPFELDAWCGKLAESSPFEEDGDVDFYGLYGTCAGIEDMELSAYWMLIRDAAGRHDTNDPWFAEEIESMVGLDDYGVTYLHTVGARWAGEHASLDWELEAAYQFGDADAVGALFAPVNWVYGDDNARWDTWGGHLELGYTFEAAWTPRVYLSAHYYGGEDNRALSFLECMNPFRKTKSSISFNRLFSDYENDAVMDLSQLSNYWLAAIGIETAPTEKLGIGMDLRYQQAIAPFAHPAYLDFGWWHLPLAPALPFWDEEGSKDLGWQASVWLAYAYSEDLSFEVGYTHWFAGSAVRDGVFALDNGLALVGGLDNCDMDYLYAQTGIEF